MPRSLTNGDYSLLLAVESSSRPNSWYRVLSDRQSGLLSCDCPPYIFNRNRDAHGKRFCPHTCIGEVLSVPPTPAAPHTGEHSTDPHPLLTATRIQWPGLRGAWSIEERDALIGTKPYHFVLLRLGLGNGGTATGVVAFAAQHHHNQVEMISGVAGWAGYAIAAEVARLGGFPFVGQPPEHFRLDRRPSTGSRQQPAASTPGIGLADILRVGDMVRPGTNPTVVAENTLRLFLGEATYALLERQGFLDVSSVRYADRERVYRLRRDPNHLRERRVRIFERGRYVSDHCIVRRHVDDCLEADFYLTNFLHFLSNEETALAVVDPNYNIFPPNSDGRERETIPAIWKPRATSIAIV